MKKTFIYGILNIIILFLLNVIFLIGLYLTNTNIKLTIIITLTLLLINIVACKSYISKSKILYNTSQFIIFIINIILFYQIININNNYNYIENIFSNKYQYNNYSLYILKKTPVYLNISNLNDKNIGILENNKENIQNIFKNEIKGTYKVYNNSEELIRNIKGGYIQSLIISDEEYENLILKNPEISYIIKNVYTIKVKDKINNNL
mgnify:CR=1 FL=1